METVKVTLKDRETLLQTVIGLETKLAWEAERKYRELYGLTVADEDELACQASFEAGFKAALHFLSEHPDWESGMGGS